MSDKKTPIGFAFAWNGIREVARTERNFRIHLAAALLVVISGFFFPLTNVEWGILILVIGLVLVTEITNSAIEKMMDYVKPDMHPAAQVIKDVAAGAVLMSAIIAVIIGLLIFLPKLDMLF
ncbi:diacylglycerol kinase family protein [Virgibacillus sp. NKC19-16]|uniref:diacylglycerol kinase family protein n=1 Tax=Virgibacillus salidurans TaxID=2831673 RepID=UPI001F38703A|nr:diacylglycerol kinase family protein [Virgibacillus sp. NKC19-16]UJL44874.1 diacylglycerol kinase family protein [Virgibacillus sp. NKC19-16]